MRKIKFRIWDKIHKTYTREVNKFLTLNDMERDEFVFLQYTGLKDKNGVEIYEGDIVFLNDTPYNHYSENFKLNEPEPYLIPQEYKIIFHKGAFVLMSKKENIYFIHYEFDTDIEVIGNIYENSKLLKDKK